METLVKFHKYGAYIKYSTKWYSIKLSIIRHGMELDQDGMLYKDLTGFNKTQGNIQVTVYWS